MRKCPLTDSTSSTPFLSLRNLTVMTSDQRIVRGRLKKIIFKESGVVANEKLFSREESETAYGDEYELNTSGGEEHFFFTREGAIPRSLVYFDWIKPFLHDEFRTLVEIGCGEGKVLERIAHSFPGKHISGFDGSYKAVELGRRKRLDISQKIIFGNDALPKSDVYLLIGVLEHVEDVEAFLLNVINALNENGRIIICIPVQDYGGYDIFFVDHSWHFTIRQFEFLLNRCGLNVVKMDSNHPINHGFGLFVCKKGKTKNVRVVNDSKVMLRNVHYWQECFNKANDWFGGTCFKKVAIFGASEIFSLFMAYSSLPKQNIIACIDDTKKPNEKKHGIPVHGSEWLYGNPVDLLVLAINKKYHDGIITRYKGLGINIQPIY